jgi:hypothetical protein
MPAKAGIQGRKHRRPTLDPRLRGDDGNEVALQSDPITR